jgi:hypothetical protein
MRYEMVRGSFLLLETVAMLSQYVNGRSYETSLDRQRFFMDQGAFASLCRRMKRLQEIMEEVCRDVDLEDPMLRRYFSCVKGPMCLALLMTYTFCTIRELDYWENVEEICRLWRELPGQGYWITSENNAADDFSFTNGPGCPGDLFSQIKALNFSSDFRMEIYDAFRDFESNLRALAASIEPLARRLEEQFSREQWMFEETQRYWEKAFAQKSPTQFVASFADQALVDRMSDRTLVAISMMNSNLLAINVAKSPFGQGSNILYIGSAIPSNGLALNHGDELETVGNMLKCIGDKKRLEILRRLSKEPTYGAELAEVMGMDPGHTSRILTQMHSYGFLREEKDRLRLYYQPDREVIHNFLELVEATIFS